MIMSDLFENVPDSEEMINVCFISEVLSAGYIRRDVDLQPIFE